MALIPIGSVVCCGKVERENPKKKIKSPMKWKKSILTSN